MNQHQYGPPAPVAPARTGGLTPGVAVLLWIFAGWPLSWLLLFIAGPVGILFGIGITVWMIVICVQGGSRPVSSAPSVVVNVGPMAGAAVAPPFRPSIDPRRAQVEGLAHINAVGGCGWCGSPAAHVNDAGYQVHPRHWHAAEIEERLRSAS